MSSMRVEIASPVSRTRGQRPGFRHFFEIAAEKAWGARAAEGPVANRPIAEASGLFTLSVELAITSGDSGRSRGPSSERPYSPKAASESAGFILDPVECLDALALSDHSGAPRVRRRRGGKLILRCSDY